MLSHTWSRPPPRALRAFLGTSPMRSFPSLARSSILATMLGHIIALLGTLAFAAALPSTTDSLAAGTPFACTLRSWVRAPDLTPGLLATADARLLANGTDCKDLVGWSVGLRFKERAIVRLPAAGVELPAKPQFNRTAMTEWFAQRGQDDIYRVGWHGEQKCPYEIEREAYGELGLLRRIARAERQLTILLLLSQHQPNFTHRTRYAQQVTLGGLRSRA